MTDPLFSVTAFEIAKLAFQEFIKAGSGETAKKLSGAGLRRVKDLRCKIVSFFQDKQHLKAQKAIELLQQEGSMELLNKLATYLDDEMEDQPVFAEELREEARQIIEINSQSSNKREYKNYGRDMINVENVEGDFKMRG